MISKRRTHNTLLIICLLTLTLAGCKNSTTAPEERSVDDEAATVQQIDTTAIKDVDADSLNTDKAEGTSVKLLPPKATYTDSSLSYFLDKLELAVDNEDMDYVLSVLYENVTVSFGGDGGIEEFKEHWNEIESPERLWKTLKQILKMGGDSYSVGDYYALPYVHTNWLEDPAYDAFEFMAIIGSNVNVRDQPNLKTSKVLGQLTYDVVAIDYQKHQVVDEVEWYYVIAENGLEGYVHGDYIWSPIGYRLGMEKIDNEWKITFLVAGD